MTDLVPSLPPDLDPFGVLAVLNSKTPALPDPLISGPPQRKRTELGSKPHEPDPVDKTSVSSDLLWPKHTGRVMGLAKVAPNVIIEEDAAIGGFAVIHGGHFKGSARIGGFAVIYGGVWDGTEGIITEGSWDGPGIVKKHDAR